MAADEYARQSYAPVAGTAAADDARGMNAGWNRRSVRPVPAVPEVDLVRIRKFCEDESPAEFRDEMRVEADVRGRSVTILECRPPWNDDGGEWTRQPLAQLRFDSASTLWSLYWADRNSRWHRYDGLDPGPVGDLVDEIKHDPTCIFWG
jgi:hypothetical protein